MSSPTIHSRGTIAFRVDASVEIGSGHVMRCLTLANDLRGRGFECIFIIATRPNNMADYVRADGFKVFEIPAFLAPLSTESETPKDSGWSQDAKHTRIAIKDFPVIQWLVIDHYSIDRRWEDVVRPMARFLLVIDDLANRAHAPTILLDQNLYDDPEGRYKTRVSTDCFLLLGPRYALLREEFHIAAEKKRTRTGSIEKILVFFGGADATGETEKTLEALSAEEFSQLKVKAIVGSLNPRATEIASRFGSRSNFEILPSSGAMAQLMSEADLAIGAGGTTSWERCFLGLPALITIVADNQIELAETLHRYGAIRILGVHSEVTQDRIRKALIELLGNPSDVLKMSTKGRSLWDSETAPTPSSSQAASSTSLSISSSGKNESVASYMERISSSPPQRDTPH